MLKRTGPLRFFSRLPPRFILRRQGPRYTAIFAFWGNFGLDGSCRQILIPRSLRNSALLAPPGSTLALGTCPKESRGAPRRTYIVGLHIYIYVYRGFWGSCPQASRGSLWSFLGMPRGSRRRRRRRHRRPRRRRPSLSSTHCEQLGQVQVSPWGLKPMSVIICTNLRSPPQGLSFLAHIYLCTRSAGGASRDGGQWRRKSRR